MKKNDEIILDITDINEDGAGIGKYQGFVFFVPAALPGDRILAGVTKLKKTYGYARIIEIVEPSKDRTEPKCPVSHKCGGCSLMALSYEAELRLKENKVKEALVRLGGFKAEFIQGITEPIIGMESPYYYRNKAQYPVSSDREGNIITGFYAPYSHRVIPCDDCKIGNPLDSQILSAIRGWMKNNDIRPYDETSHKGLVRHILIRHGNGTGQIMVCLVINQSSNKSVKAEDALVKTLLDIDGISSICVNYNSSKGNNILGKESVSIWGVGHITDTNIYGLSFNISPASFYQVNSTQMKRLYEKAIEYANLSGDENVWDLYSGIGTITLALSKNAKHVLGIEVSHDAILNAKENAAENGISNVSFFEGPTEDVLSSEIIPEDLKHPDIVVLDPPRKGCDPTVLAAIIETSTPKIVYVSCNPSTLARDLKILSAGGYSLEKVAPVDQFCRTMHVETVCLLSNRKADAKIRIDVDLEDYYAIKDAKKSQN